MTRRTPANRPYMASEIAAQLPVTDAQRSFFTSLLGELGWSIQEALKGAKIEKPGLDQLNRREASRLIEWLLEQRRPCD